MCRQNGKRWKDYRDSDRCQHYLNALESVAGISFHALVQTTEIRVFDLIESRHGQGGGTWIHPQVAIDLAR